MTTKPIKSVPFQKTGYFSKLICDYLDKDTKIAPFYENFPDIDGFKKQLEKKQLSGQSRSILVEALLHQYQKIKASKKTTHNINALKNETTFTVTTGHQLNLFTGPLYFMYKIIAAINLAEQLKKEFPKNDFVPVYWMATEDHDFEEINFFNFKDEKVQWKRESQGAVGRLSTEGLDQVFDIFSKQLGDSKNADELRTLFQEAYLKHSNLTDATRYLANALFGAYGLVIIDGDDTVLKKLFIPYVEEELINKTSFKNVSNTIESLKKEYKIQVNPREINLFYLTDGLRERILLEGSKYKVNNTDITWSKEEILKEVSDFPERFSPNVILRPLYQEVILPNLCYIGGGGELAYWFELKSMFTAFKVPFPILMLRTSAVLASSKQLQKLEKLKVSVQDIFLKQNDLITKKTKEISDIKIDFSSQRKHLQQQFKDLEVLAKKTDKSFIGAVKAQEAKQLKGLNMLEKRLLKAQKRKLSSELERVVILQDQLFPKQSLEERYRNFSEIYEVHGAYFIEQLKEELDPLLGEFQIIEL